jgi:hypothetical protein
MLKWALANGHPEGDGSDDKDEEDSSKDDSSEDDGEESERVMTCVCFC